MLLLYLSITYSPVSIILSHRTSLVSSNRSISQSYTVHDPIEIANDVELAAVANSGTGAPNDPYIIAGWNITGSPTHGIYISVTTKHFRIENCWINSSNEHGIFVDNVATGTTSIVNNTCINNGEYGKHGISLINSSFSTLTNNTCNNYYHGIFLWDSSFSTLTNNTCNSNTRSGIRLDSSGSSTLINNTCNSNERGIILSESSSSTIINNICNDNDEEGIFLWDSSFSTLTNNICNDNDEEGILLENSGSSTLINNTCNNNRWFGIFLWDSSFSTLTNNICNDNDEEGIRLDNSGSSTITNNTCNSNTRSGIFLDHSDSSTLTNNTCTNNGVGISLDNSSFSTVANNTCINNYYEGIEVSDSDSVTLTNNICNDTNFRGIILYDSDSSTLINNTCTNNGNGIDLWNSSSLIFTNNTCSNNDRFGIWLDPRCFGSTLSKNTCDRNGMTGILISGGRMGCGDPGPLTLTNNSFIDNGISLECTPIMTLINNTFVNGGLSFEAESKEQFLSCTVVNNTVNNLPLGYFENLTDYTVSDPYGQLLLINCNNTIVKNQHCSNVSIGIALYYCHDSQLVNNTCINNEDGIYLFNSSSSTLVKNTCNDNGKHGISLEHSSSSTVANNTCTNNSWWGIYLYFSKFSTIINNSFINNAFYFEIPDKSSKEEFFSFTVENNTVNGLPLGYFENLTDKTIIEPYGQLILVNCNKTIVKNQHCSNVSIGIALYYCHENQLVNNTVTNNSRQGFFLERSDYNVLSKNKVENNIENGISFSMSNYCTISSNNISTNLLNGIFIEKSDGCSISNNSIDNNKHNGIFISNSSTIVISENFITNNSRYGVEFEPISEDGTITGNSISYNHGYGIYMGFRCSNIDVFWNNFTRNNFAGRSQAFDSYWSGTTHSKNEFSYNYWDDWTTPDNDNDGFVDSSYSIEGGANNQDEYPRADLFPSTLNTTTTTSDIQTGTSTMITTPEQGAVESFEEIVQTVIAILLLVTVSSTGIILGKRVAKPYIREQLKKRKKKDTSETLRILIDMTDN